MINSIKFFSAIFTFIFAISYNTFAQTNWVEDPLINQPTAGGAALGVWGGGLVEQPLQLLTGFTQEPPQSIIFNTDAAGPAAQATPNFSWYTNERMRINQPDPGGNGTPGDVGINTIRAEVVPDPYCLLHVQEGSVLFDGGIVGGGASMPSWMPRGDNPAMGPGVRFMWIPGMAGVQQGAIRAGIVGNNYWDPGFIGVASAAFGKNTLASGSASFAACDLTHATGDASAALGNQTLAQGFASFAVGENAIATGWTSFAAGSITMASGRVSLAAGQNTEASGDFSTALGNSVSTNGMAGSFILGDNNPSINIGAIMNANQNPDAITMRFTASNVVGALAYEFYTNNDAAFPTGVGLLSGGVGWVALSDRNAKDNFQEVDLEKHLEAINRIPVTTWTYKGGSPDYRYMGPMAQDFNREFELGDDNSLTLNHVIMDGVNMAGIKGLIERTDNLKNENTNLKSDVENLKVDNERLKSDNQNLQLEVESLKQNNDNLRSRLEALEEKAGITSIEVDAEIQDIILEQNVPNPFDGSCVISYFVPGGSQGDVELIISDLSGNKIVETHQINSNTPSQLAISSENLDSGVYIYGIAVNGKIIKSKKMMIIK